MSLLRAPRTWLVGVATYQDHAVGDGGSPRIVVPVRVEGIDTVAVLDTGAPWCVLDPELVEACGLSTEPDRDPVRLRVRGDVLEGDLIRARLVLLADAGEDVEVEGTFFVPRIDEGDVWPHPNFLGLQGCLERVRFAVDPLENEFGFGPAVAGARVGGG